MTLAVLLHVTVALLALEPCLYRVAGVDWQRRLPRVAWGLAAVLVVVAAVASAS